MSILVFCFGMDGQMKGMLSTAAWLILFSATSFGQIEPVSQDTLVFEDELVPDASTMTRKASYPAEEWIGLLDQTWSTGDYSIIHDRLLPELQRDSQAIKQALQDIARIYPRLGTRYVKGTNPYIETSFTDRRHRVHLSIKHHLIDHEGSMKIYNLWIYETRDTIYRKSFFPVLLDTIAKLNARFDEPVVEDYDERIRMCRYVIDALNDPANGVVLRRADFKRSVSALFDAWIRLGYPTKDILSFDGLNQRDAAIRRQVDNLKWHYAIISYAERDEWDQLASFLNDHEKQVRVEGSSPIPEFYRDPDDYRSFDPTYHRIVELVDALGE